MADLTSMSSARSQDAKAEAAKTEAGLSLRQQAWAVNSAGLLLLVLLSLAVTTVYVLPERTIYFWDYAYYHVEVLRQTDIYRHSFLDGLRSLKGSLAADYPFTWCPPLVPLLVVLGPSRIAYEVSLTLVYQLPLFLIMGAIATGLVPRSGRATYWVSAFIVLFLPFAWYSMLRGWPDVGAAALIALAVALYLKDTRLSHWWQVVGIGLLLPMTALFRRHYVYDCEAFVGAVVLHSLLSLLLRLRREPRECLREGFRKAIRIGAIGLISLAVMLTIGRSYVRHILAVDRSTLYAFYYRPYAVVVSFYLHEFGRSMVLVALAGFVVGWTKFAAERSAICFVAIFGALLALLWVVFASVNSLTYDQHFVMPLAMGIILAFWSAWRSVRRWLRIAGCAIVGGLVLLNFSIGLGPAKSLSRWPAIAAWFAQSHPRFERKDFAEVVRLTNTLRQLAGTSRCVVIAGGSEYLNDDLVRNAGWQLYGYDQPQPSILSSPHVDSRDHYPFENVLFADYLAVRQPRQDELGTFQRVVWVAGEIFAKQWEISRDFELLPDSFAIDGGDPVRIYKRIRPTATAIAWRTLDQMIEAVGRRPGGQPDWVFLSGPPPWHAPKPEEQHHTHLGFESREPAAPLLMSMAFAPPRGEVRGDLNFDDEHCVGAKILLSLLAGDGTKTAVAQTILRTQGGGRRQSFRFAFSAPAKRRLLLTLATIDEQPSSRDGGSVYLDRMEVTTR